MKKSKLVNDNSVKKTPEEPSKSGKKKLIFFLVLFAVYALTIAKAAELDREEMNSREASDM